MSEKDYIPLEEQIAAAEAKRLRRGTQDGAWSGPIDDEVPELVIQK